MQAQHEGTLRPRNSAEIQKTSSLGIVVLSNKIAEIYRGEISQGYVIGIFHLYALRRPLPTVALLLSRDCQIGAAARRESLAS